MTQAMTLKATYEFADESEEDHEHLVDTDKHFVIELPNGGNIHFLIDLTASSVIIPLVDGVREDVQSANNNNLITYVFSVPPQEDKRRKVVRVYENDNPSPNIFAFPDGYLKIGRLTFFLLQHGSGLYVTDYIPRSREFKMCDGQPCIQLTWRG